MKRDHKYNKLCYIFCITLSIVKYPAIYIHKIREDNYLRETVKLFAYSAIKLVCLDYWFTH